MSRLSIALLLFFLLSAWSHAASVPAPPNVGAKAAFLMDAQSGRILASQNPDRKHPPASLAKLMTAYLTFQAVKDGQVRLDEKVRISKEVWEVKGSQMFLKVGERVAVEKLLHGLVVQSGNDAALALAEFVGGGKDTFVRMMNRKARELGMENTHYTGPAGMPDPEMHATAQDLALLAQAVLNDFPQYLKMFSQRALTHNGIKQSNRNRLLWRLEGADGLKTGHTKEAGYNLIGTAKRDGMRLIGVVLGARSDNRRFDAMQGLINYGFRFYETKKLYARGEVVEQARIWQGAKQNLALTLADSLYVTVPRNSASEVQLKAELRAPLTAPVKAEEQVGWLHVDLAGRSLSRRPLLAQDTVASAGWVRYLLDAARLQWRAFWQGQKQRFLAQDEGEPSGAAAAGSAQPG
ncbi:D-alanyl-D-alanine carboxypeptidase family protein [Thiohalorhabdus sp. Cl-TMA]|uniref:serine-type D-Ala-D-Ala carboxypeptidase n=1 Tax=Thiohalorhabdus methylotrophus TaxID=3242694 RepID=A0ABV4TV08_9GAMM